MNDEIKVRSVGFVATMVAVVALGVTGCATSNLGVTVEAKAKDPKSLLAPFWAGVQNGMSTKKVDPVGLTCDMCAELGIPDFAPRPDDNKLTLVFPQANLAILEAIVTSFSDVNASQTGEKLAITFTPNADPVPACSPPFPTSCKARAICNVPPQSGSYGTPGCTKSAPTCTACTMP